MRGTVSSAALTAAIKSAQTIIVGAAKIDALRHIRLTASGGSLEVEATNFDQHMALRVDAALSPGVAIVDPARLLISLQPIRGEVSISCTDGFMSVSGEGSRSRLALLPPATWANVELPTADETSFDVKAESLLAAFATVLPAVSTDPSIYYLMGAHLKWDGPDLILEACDRFVILSREIEARKPKAWPSDSIILPREFMIAASKLLAGDGATLSISSHRVILTAPTGRLASKLIEGTYPGLDRLWDKAAAPVLRADRKSLLGVTKLAHQFSDSDGDSLRCMVIHDSEVIAVGGNGEKFQAAFDGEYIKKQDYSFQPKILLAVLSVLTSDTVELTDGGKMPSTVVIHGDGARTCVAMQRETPAWWHREVAATEKAEAA